MNSCVFSKPWNVKPAAQFPCLAYLFHKHTRNGKNWYKHEWKERRAQRRLGFIGTKYTLEERLLQHLSQQV